MAAPFEDQVVIDEPATTTETATEEESQAAPAAVEEAEAEPEKPKDLKPFNKPRLISDRPPSFQKKRLLEEKFSNSTSSLYISDVITKPNVPYLIKCLAKSLYDMFPEVTVDDIEYPQIFSEVVHPITTRPPILVKPTCANIEHFILKVFEAASVSSECAVICWIYLTRIVESASFVLHPTNWRRVVLASIILASKAWDDLAVWNVDFAGVADAVDVKDLNHMEIAVLQLLEFSVTVHASTYAEMYFNLRDVLDVEKHNFPDKPIDMEVARRLELTTSSHEERVMNERKSVRRTQSLCDVPKFTPKAVIN